MRKLAAEFVGDPLTARRVLERWGLGDAAGVRRLVRELVSLGLFEPSDG